MCAGMAKSMDTSKCDGNSNGASLGTPSAPRYRPSRTGLGDALAGLAADSEKHRQIRRMLRGRTHTLATAIVCRRGPGMLWQHAALPRLTMRLFSNPFLNAYLAAEGEHVLGSVGAYRLEGPGVQLFSAVEGDHAAILGLPLLPLLAYLRKAGVLWG